MIGSTLFTISVTIFAIIVPYVSGNACANTTESDVTFIPNPTLCSDYIICQHSKVQGGGSCGNSFAFIDGSCKLDGKCEESKLTNICLGKDDTKTVASPDNCKDYYYCLNGAGFLGTCPTDTMYNETARGCVSNPGNECPIGFTPSYVCKGQPPGKFMPSSLNCYEYYVCTGAEEGKLGDCPSDLLFDPKAVSCVYPDDYTCPIPGGERPITTPEPTTEAPPDKKLCSSVTGTNLFVNDPNSCKGYYYCAEGRNTQVPQKGVCANNYYFDSVLQKCVPQEDFACDLPPCKGEPIGKFVSDPLTCNGYYYCDGSDKGIHKECTGEYQFDELNQNCNVASVVKCKLPGGGPAESPTENPAAADKKQ